MSKQPQYTDHTPQSGEISPKEQEYESHICITPKSGEILPNQQGKDNPSHTMPSLNEIPPKEPHEVTDLVAMEEGAMTKTPNTNRYCTTLFR